VKIRLLVLANVKFPVIVSPDLSKFNDAAPVKEPVIVPAEKFPDPSRATIALAVLLDVAVVAEFDTKPAVDKVTKFPFGICKFTDEPKSAVTNKEVLNDPEALLCTKPAELRDDIT
jgi:hypothetical protein